MTLVAGTIKTHEPIFQIKRNNGKISSITVIMPVWQERGEDEKVYLKLPMLGGLRTYASNTQDSEKAIKEAIQIFCTAAEKHGLGIEGELQILGWNISSEDNDNTQLKMQISSPMFDLMLDTGEPTAVNIEMEAA
jgi:hypothetical protein